MFYFGEKCKLPKASKNVDKIGDFWLHFSVRVWKLEAPFTKNSHTKTTLITFEAMKKISIFEIILFSVAIFFVLKSGS